MSINIGPQMFWKITSLKRLTNFSRKEILVGFCSGKAIFATLPQTDCITRCFTVNFAKFLNLFHRTLENSCNFTKSNPPPWVFLTFSKSYKWVQIAQSITYDSLIYYILKSKYHSQSRKLKSHSRIKSLKKWLFKTTFSMLHFNLLV